MHPEKSSLPTCSQNKTGMETPRAHIPEIQTPGECSTHSKYNTGWRETRIQIALFVSPRWWGSRFVFINAWGMVVKRKHRLYNLSADQEMVYLAALAQSCLATPASLQRWAEWGETAQLGVGWEPEQIFSPVWLVFPRSGTDWRQQPRVMLRNIKPDARLLFWFATSDFPISE